MSDLAFVPATEQAERVSTHDVSPVELVETYLEPIAALDSRLNSYVTVVGERALADARIAEGRVGTTEELPPWHGVPISTKDLTETAGIRTTFSCKHYADYVPARDAAVIARLKRAGFIVIGKTNTPEFGTVPQAESELNGICRNPWSLGHTPGGSSGGAAAGVAAGLAAMAQGSDGGGSIRVPASCCGLFGLKPARGRVSHAPAGDSLFGFGTDGPITRTVRDAAGALDAMAGYETGDPCWAPPPSRPFVEEVGAEPGRLRIAFSLRPAVEAELEPEVADAARDTAKLLESLGHVVEEVDPGWFDPTLSSSFLTIFQGLSADFLDLDLDNVEPLNRMLAESARATSMVDYIRAGTALAASVRSIMSLWDDYDVLLTPTMPVTPRPAGWMFEDPDPWAQLARASMIVAFTAPANASGQPAVSLPLHWSSQGLPIGSQLIGAPAGEATLIRLSARLEEARPWAHRRPPL
jgi:amidase